MQTSSPPAPGHRLRIRTKFVMAMTVQALLVALLVIAIERFSTRRAIMTQTKSHAAAIADTVASTASSFVVFGITADLETIAADLKSNPSVQYADFVTREGKQLAATSGAIKPPEFLKVPNSRTGTDQIAEQDDGSPLLLAIRPVFESREAAASPQALPAGYFRVAMTQQEAEKVLSQSSRWNAGVVILVVLLSVVLGAIGARPIVNPLRQLSAAAAEIARGDLTRRAEIATGDEIGELAGAFNAMARNLEKTVAKVAQAQGNIHSVAETISSRSGTLMTQADEQRGSLENAYVSIDRLNGGIRKISDNVETLAAASEETSSSILQMVASIEEVGRHTDSLFGSVEETASATHQMVTSISEVDQNMDFLRNFVTETSASMVEMTASITQVGSNAQRSYDLTLAVAEAAEGGMRSVRETMDGMEEIRRAVNDSNDVLSRLGDRSLEIGKIINVIDDVAEQTNLLALNAAILAAQAGEQGKGFSVVAAEIRELSERTANSTREIGGLIRSVQEEVTNAMSTMTRGSSLVERGVGLAQESGRSLTTILDSASKASQMGREIAGATREQTAGSETVAKAIGRVQDMVKQINAATGQQAAGSDHIMKAVEQMRDATRYVRQATVEQKSGSSMILRAAERMIDMVREIFDVTKGQASESGRIVQTMERVRDIAETNRRAAADMGSTIGMLNNAVRELEDEVHGFRTRS